MSTPTPLSVSLAGEIASELDRAGLFKPSTPPKSQIAAQLIQRRVEPLERALEAIATAHDAKEKHSGEIMQGVAKHALARIKEGR